MQRHVCSIQKPCCAWANRGYFQAPSTRIRIFLKTHFFIRFGLASTRRRRFGHQKRSFSKTLSRVDLFENAVFVLSCGRVKTELFENADVTASIYDVPEHSHRSLGITHGHFDCLFSFVKFEQRSLKAAVSSCGRGYFRKRTSCGRR